VTIIRTNRGRTAIMLLVVEAAFVKLCASMQLLHGFLVMLVGAGVWVSLQIDIVGAGVGVELVGAAEVLVVGFDVHIVQTGWVGTGI